MAYRRRRATLSDTPDAPGNLRGTVQRKCPRRRKSGTPHHTPRTASVVRRGAPQWCPAPVSASGTKAGRAASGLGLGRS